MKNVTSALQVREAVWAVIKYLVMVAGLVAFIFIIVLW